VNTSGSDVSLLGSSGKSLNVFGVPRLAFDGMFQNGLTLGGSLSYLVVSGKTETSTLVSGTRSQDEPTNAIFILAPRAGVVIAASKLLGVWLRGGFSRISQATDRKVVDAFSGAIVKTTSTATLVNLTLDPQLLINPVPHVGITLGALLDIGLGGSRELSTSTSTSDLTASSYGVTTGLVAIF
jgi:hypothetical protein